MTKTKEKTELKNLSSFTHTAVLKKSPKDLAVMVEDGGSVEVIRIGGRVNRYQLRDGNFGESVCFLGIFVVKNLLNDELFKTGRAYLPSILTDNLKRAVDNADGSPVEFDTIIELTQSEKSGRGYAFISSDVKSPEAVEQENQIADQLLSKM